MPVAPRVLFTVAHLACCLHPRADTVRITCMEADFRNLARLCVHTKTWKLTGKPAGLQIRVRTAARIQFVTHVQIRSCVLNQIQRNPFIRSHPAHLPRSPSTSLHSIDHARTTFPQSLPLYQSHPTGLFGYFPFHHPVPHLTIRGPIPIRC